MDKHHEFDFLGQTIKITFREKVDKSLIEGFIWEIMNKISSIYDFARVKLIFECENGYMKADLIIIAGRNQLNFESKINNGINSGKLIMSIIVRKTTNSSNYKHLLNIINEIKESIKEIEEITILL